LTENIDSLLNRALSEQNQDLAKKVRDRVQMELMTAFRNMELQTSSLASLPERNIIEHRPGTGTVVAPGLPGLIKWIAKHEPKYSFFSIKFLRERVFAKDPVLQEALQFAIDNGVLETYDQPNPKNPAWPTKACRLKRDHPTVQGILAETDTPETDTP
jgi:hypothetical protein